MKKAELSLYLSLFPSDFRPFMMSHPVILCPRMSESVSKWFNLCAVWKVILRRPFSLSYSSRRLLRHGNISLSTESELLTAVTACWSLYFWDAGDISALRLCVEHWQQKRDFKKRKRKKEASRSLHTVFKKHKQTVSLQWKSDLKMFSETGL